MITLADVFRFTTIACLAAASLVAQPPDPPPPNGNGATEDPPQVPAPGEVTRRDLDRLRSGIEQHIRDEVDDAVRRRFENFAPLRSRRELFLEFSGGVAVKYRQTQYEPRGDQPAGGARSPNGINLSRAWMTVFAGYSDVVESEFKLLYNGDYSLLDEDIIEVPKAVIVYNNPFSQFAPPATFADSFLFGVDGPFWRQTRGSETMALGHRAFHQDEAAQFRYTLRIRENFYMIGALSSGTLLGRAHVDDSNNYPILQDDKTRFIRGMGDRLEVSRYIQSEFGAGFIFDWNSLSFLRSDAHFSPEHATASNTNYFNILGWGSINQLSHNEISLIEGMMRVPFFGGTQSEPGRHIRRAKWRAGVNADFAFRVGGGDLFMHAHFVHAEDSRFVRDAWGVEARYTFELPRIPFFFRITPLFRYSELVTNNSDNPLDATNPFDNPLRVSSGAVPGFSLADAAGFAANRREFMLGVNLTLARNVILGFEVVFNEEDFKQSRNVPNDVPNTLYLLRIVAEF